MMMSALKMIADRMALCGVDSCMMLSTPKLRIEGEKDRRDDGEILSHVVGNRERGERAARHQQLFADLDDFDQLGRIGIKIDHVAGFARGLRAALHGNADIGLRESGRVIGAVAAHGDQPALRLLIADIAQLVLGRCLGDEIVNAGFRGNRRRRHRIVAGDHHGLDAHAAHGGEALLHVRLHHVFQVDDAEHAAAFHKTERRPTGTRDLVNRGAECRRLGDVAAGLLRARI